MDEKLFYSIVEKAKKYDEVTFFNKDNKIHCSFCGKSQNEVRKLISAAHVFICDECVETCNKILEEENDK